MKMIGDRRCTWDAPPKRPKNIAIHNKRICAAYFFLCLCRGLVPRNPILCVELKSRIIYLLANVTSRIIRHSYTFINWRIFLFISHMLKQLYVPELGRGWEQMQNEARKMNANRLFSPDTNVISLKLLPYAN